MAQGAATIDDQRSTASVRRYTYGALVALVLAPLGPVHPSFPSVAVVLAIAAAVASARAASWIGLRVAGFAAILGLSSLTNMPYGIWTGVLLLVLCSLRWRVLVPGDGWLPTGTMTRPAWWLASATVLVASVALTSWALTTTRFGKSTEELLDALSDVPIAVLIIGGTGFVIVNALAEEVGYRGIAYEAAVSAMPARFAILVQGTAFGAAHIAGFPAGVLGVGLAAVYGITLGVLRYMTKGIRLPILVHIAADATIVTLFITVLLPD